MSAAPAPMSSAVRNLAVFIDADNLCDPTALDHVLTDLRQRAGRVLYKRAYGRAESLRVIEPVLWRHGVRPVANMIVNKVTTDSALVIDAVEAVCTNAIDAVAICSGDADFVPLATWLREKGCQVWCFSLADRIFANPESFYDDVVLMELVDSTQPSPAVVEVEAVEPPVASIASAPPEPPRESDGVQQVLAAFPALRTGQPQHLNQVVAALRRKGILRPSDKTAGWFRQHAVAFHLSPNVAPNRICYVRQTSVTPAKADPPAALHQNAQLMFLLRQAAQASQDAQGWASVSSMRERLGNRQVFDARAHGFATLTQLLAATGVFELRGAGTPQVAVRLVDFASPASAHAAVAAAPAVVTWPSASGRRPAPPLPPHLHVLRAALQQLAAQRVQREDVLKAVPELTFGAACALHSVAGRLRERGLLGPAQSALRILERHPQSFEVNLSQHPQTVRRIGPIAI